MVLNFVIKWCQLFILLNFVTRDTRWRQMEKTKIVHNSFAWNKKKNPDCWFVYGIDQIPKPMLCAGQCPNNLIYASRLIKFWIRITVNKCWQGIVGKCELWFLFHMLTTSSHWPQFVPKLYFAVRSQLQCWCQVLWRHIHHLPPIYGDRFLSLFRTRQERVCNNRKDWHGNYPTHTIDWSTI